MSETEIQSLVSRWAGLGAMFSVTDSTHNTDVERLLLDTARFTASNSRLFIFAVTWLAHYGDYVARHRLARLILHELQSQHRPTMGLILEMALEKSDRRSAHFNQSIQVCGHTIDHRPLFDIDQRSEFSRNRAKETACALSIKWGRWLEDFELKNDALRPASWIVAHNHSIRERADLKGDLRASILAELHANPAAGASESELTQACGATRTAIRAALRRLELSDRIRRRHFGNRITIHRIDRHAA